MYPRFRIPMLLFAGLLLLAAEASSVPVRIGIPAVEGGLAAARTWNAVCSHLAENGGLDVRYQVFEDHAGLLRSLKERFVDVALLDPAWFLWKRDALAPLAEVRFAGTEERSVLIAQKSSIVYRIEDFSGASFAFARPFATSAGYFVPLAMLASSGVKLANLRRAVNAETSEGVLKGVAYGGLDGGAVPERFLDKSGNILSDFVRVVAESRPLPFPILARRREDDGDRYLGLEEALLSMKKGQSGREALVSAGIEEFRAPVPGAFDELASYLAVFESVYGAPK